MTNGIFETTLGMIDKIQKLQGKTKLKFYQYVSNYYDEKKYRRQNGHFKFEEDVFSKGGEGIATIMHEIFIKNEISTNKTTSWKYEY